MATGKAGTVRAGLFDHNSNAEAARAGVSWP